MANDARARAAVRGWLLSGRPPEVPGLPAPDLVAAAAEQGLSGLLAASAVRAGLPLPDDLAEALRRARLGALASAERHLDVARQARELLAGEGLRSLPLKGAALAGWLYDEPGERPMGDVDLLALDDWDRSRQALERAGFVEQERADHARSYLAPDSGVMLELHHSVTSCPGLFPCDREGLWARHVEGPGGPRASAEDALVQLALHAAFQHGLAVRLIQYVDLRRLLERAAPDPAQVLELARGSHACGAVALALEAAALLAGAVIPAELGEALEAAAVGRAAPLARGRPSRPGGPARARAAAAAAGALGAGGRPAAALPGRHLGPTRAGRGGGLAAAVARDPSRPGAGPPLGSAPGGLRRGAN